MLSFNPITGQLDFVNPATDVSGKLDLTGGTVTGQLVLTNASSTGALNLAPTWNNAGTDFSLIYGRVTNTASGASSKLINIGTVAGGSKLALGKAGDFVLDADSGFTGNLWEVKVNGTTQAFVNYVGQGVFTRLFTGSGPGIGTGIFDNHLVIAGTGDLRWTSASSYSSGVAAWHLQGAAQLRATDAFTGWAAVDSLYDRYGSGSPEGVVTAPVGAVYHRTDGGSGTSIYVKESGAGDTGWVAVDISGKLDLTGGTVTGQLVLTGASATGALNLSPTWNNGAVDFAGIYGRVTNTASGANSRLMSLGTVAGGELFGIVPNGNIMLGYDGHIKFNAGAADAGAEDVGIVRTAVGTLKVSDAGTGHGTLDVGGLAVSGAPGATYSGAVLSITVINGIVTAVT